nr:MAG TPA: hypothetical protein [Caudoviricetes sp.]DAM99661.1 MAG TPA: hypothetical protein [Caudoviricetes sp.]
MAQSARNDAELDRIFMPLLKNAVDYVVQKIWNENRELVRQIVYESYTPEEYSRTGEFKQAWDTDVKTVQNVVEGTFKFDPRLLTVNGEHHGSIIDGQPMTTYLAEVIYEGLSGAIYQSGYAKNAPRFKGQAWTKKRDVWTALIKWLGKDNMRKLFEEGMRKQGITFQRRQAGIGMVNIKGK